MSGRSYGLLSFVVLIVLGALPGDGTAALVVTLQPEMTVVDPGTTSYVDVFVTSTNAPASPDPVTGYALEAQIAPTTGGITFLNSGTLVSSATAAPDGYIFPTPNIDSGFPTDGDFSLSYLDTSATETQVSSSTTFGAGRIFFEVDANATGGVQTISLNESGSFFLDDDGAPYPGTALDFAGATAAFTVTPAAVPEPSSTLLLALAGVGGYAIRRRRGARRLTGRVSSTDDAAFRSSWRGGPL